MDGFVYALNQRNQDGRLAMGYYDDRDLPYYWNLADHYVLFDHFFSSAKDGSFANHMYWVAGVSPSAERGQQLSEMLATVPTIFDRLEAAGISGNSTFKTMTRPSPTAMWLSVATGPHR